VTKTTDLKAELVTHVRNSIGPIAKPEEIQFADALPKTRSGKIMRRILRKIASGISMTSGISLRSLTLRSWDCLLKKENKTDNSINHANNQSGNGTSEEYDITPLKKNG